MNIKRWLGWALLVFAAWWIVQNPTGAGHLVHSAGTWLSHAAASASTFLSSI